uniref:hypothetical protein n=1 Tax=Nonomuraea pusilla TaxID=46177 RepID=UPI00159CC0B6|nr:hypothetical protein [Nonomuraea pusilla]
MKFSERVEGVLRAAGWEQKRSVDVPEWRSRFGERDPISGSHPERPDAYTG